MMNLKAFSAIYDRYQLSGLTIKDFCSNENIREARFYYWQRKYRTHNQNQELPTGFVPLLFNSSGLQHKQPVSPAAVPVLEQKTSDLYEIVYPNGVCLRLPSGTGMKQVESFIFLRH
jgi:hypothetical protein